MELENFSERMSRILLFSPLYRLRERKLTRRDGTETTAMELGLMTLLFFFEHPRTRGFLAGCDEQPDLRCIPGL